MQATGLQPHVVVVPSTFVSAVQMMLVPIVDGVQPETFVYAELA